MPNHGAVESNKVAGLMRRAIPHELRHPSGADEPRPADKLQAAARSPVGRAASGDLGAIRVPPVQRPRVTKPKRAPQKIW
jgi:hypothetical protein